MKDGRLNKRGSCAAMWVSPHVHIYKAVFLTHTNALFYADKDFRLIYISYHIFGSRR